MHRVGASPAEAFELARAVAAHPQLHLEGLFTHFAVADEPGRPFTAEQLALFQQVVAGLAAEGIRPPLLHAANSAGALAHPGSRYQMVRPGIAVYGLAPAASMESEASVRALTPALSLRARVSYVRRWRRARRSRTGSVTASPGTLWWPLSRSATPTVCLAGCPKWGARY